VLPWLRDFVRDVLAVVETPDPVVEFGALQVEPGQDADLRPLFAGRPYLGTDLRPGPGVDRVEDLRALTLADGSVGTALCLETLEHCEDPFAAGRELARDYWRFTPEGLRVVLSGFDDVWTAGLGDPGMPVTVLGVAAHGRALGLSLERLPSVAARHARYVAGDGTVRIGPLRLTPRELARLAAREGRRLAAARLRRRATLGP